MLNYQRHKRVPVVDFLKRTWSNKEITKVPMWCNVDLRDDNQALAEPMVVGEKVEMSNLLAKPGFKEIEVGFPAALRIEYDFLRTLVERKLILDDVEVQVLVQRREHLIKRTSGTLEGAEKTIVHIYSPISTLQRDVVFHKDREDIKDIAVIGTKTAQRYMTDCDTQIRLKYSSKSFTSAELDFALDICTVVQETWGATRENPTITNPPSTVEMTIPNVYADQIEWMDTHFENREGIISSIHPHNDRGEGVASTELVPLVGADRVEGTPFGNGGRTGNVDILTVAYNMFLQGINPELNIENIREIADICERCTKMDIPPRHLHAGKPVLTAFSGSHQNAINKGMQAFHKRNGQYWEAPYSPIDPSDTGRECESIVRISNQSGEGGVTFVMDTSYGLKLLKGMHKEFTGVIQKTSEQQGEVAPEQIIEESKKNYLGCKEPMYLRKCCMTDTEIGDDEFATLAEVIYSDHSIEKTLEGVGNGPTDAVQRGMEDTLGIQIKVLDYSKYVLASGSGAEAISYVHLVDQVTDKATYGTGISSNITRASLRDIFSAVNRLFC